MLAACLCPLLAGVARGAEPVTAEQLQARMDGIVLEIKRLQSPDGSWSTEPVATGRWSTGETALAVLSLSTAGLGAEDVALARGVEHLLGVRAATVYEASLKLMALDSVDRQRYRAQIAECAGYLVEHQRTPGGWSYNGFKDRRQPDNSNSQFAVLALHTAASAGVEVPTPVWERAREYFAGCHNRDGGWGYEPGDGDSYGSMTVAGLASMDVCNVWLHVAGGVCGQEDERYEQRVQAGLAWLGENFSVKENPRHKFWNNYYLYGLERAGAIGARRYMGQHDWYLEGVSHLASDPSALEAAEGQLEWPLVSKCFALLFLAKGNAPVLMHKAQWQGEWNAHRYDAKFLADYAGKQLGQRLTWQIVPLQAPVDHLLAAPILYISGRGEINWTEAEIQHLEAYMEGGGIALVEANGGDAAFDRSFRKVLADHFPDMSLEPLPAAHPVYTSYFRDLPDDARLPLEAVGGPCWTTLFYCPGGLSCPWDIADYSHPNFKLGMNIIAFVTHVDSLRGKLETQSRPVAEPRQATELRGAFVVGQLVHDGDWQPHRGRAWPRVLASVHKATGVGLFSEPVAIDPERDSLFQAHLLNVTGTRSFELSRNAKEKLKQYVARGGFVFAEAACGSREFDKAFRALMEELFPEQPLGEVPQGHPLYALGGQLPEVRYSPAVLQERPALAHPSLECIELEGRLVVVYSQYDLSSAIAGHPCHGCPSVLEPSGTELMLKMILYALGG